MSRRSSLITATLLVLASLPTHAEIEPILTIGFESGGDKLVTTTNSDLNAGSGIKLGAGMSFSQPGSSLSYRAILHYLFNIVEFTTPDGEAYADAFPLELGVFNGWSRHEIGAGLSHHLNPSYEISFNNSYIKSHINFDNATGLFLQYNYIFSKAETATYTTDTYVGLKITAMDYEAGNTKLNANSIGVFLGSKF